MNRKNTFGTTRHTINTIISAPRANIIFTKELVILETVNTYFGTYVFFSRDAFPMMEKIACVVDSLIKL